MVCSRAAYALLIVPVGTLMILHVSYRMQIEAINYGKVYSTLFVKRNQCQSRMPSF